MSHNLYTNASRQPTDANQLGGKGANLVKLAKIFPVPPFVIIPASFFDGEASQTLPSKIEFIIPQILEELSGEKNYAVRSSATIEDGSSHSFAGQFTTLLNVPFEELKEAIIKIYESQFVAHVETYKTEAGITTQHSMAVVIQQMVDATVSGVAFSINPVTGNKEEVVINAVAGLGDALVSGQQNGDTYIVAKGEIEDKKFVGNRLVLSDEKIGLLVSYVKQIEAFFNCPQDIEFAFENDAFYLLQSRPVTTISNNKEQTFWDNSNIVESYPGLTLPLTFFFIEKMYEAVYRQFSLVLGVSSKTVEKNKAVYANMLGLLNGRVYYNLNSWYRSLAQLPGYNVNAEFMEKMMGVKEKLPIQIETISKGRISNYWEILNAVAGITKNLLKAKRGKEEFVQAFDEVYNRFDTKDYKGKPLEEIIKDYQEFEHLMVSRWKAPLVNDLFAMIYFGLLQKQCVKYAPELSNLHNQLIASSKDIITTEPMRRLPVLAKKLAENSVLNSLFTTSNASAIWEQLCQPEYAEYKAVIDEYIQVWGERSVAELKLETITYRQEPERLIGLLQSYIQSSIFSYTESENVAIERTSAEEIIRQRLRGKWLKAKVFWHILKQARYFVSNRENLRYYRTKGFGMVRRMMIAAGETLQAENRLEQSRDIFYLQFTEVINAVDNSKIEDLKAVVNERKKDYDLYDKMPLPERIISNGKPDKFIMNAGPDKPDKSNANVLQGLPCSAGVVRSKIKIVKEASALKSLNGNILATYATDPGWVVLFPSASGIITERGSLLSHAAIVSREMGIPCIVGVEGLLQNVPDESEIIMDGSTGIIQIINTPAA